MIISLSNGIQAKLYRYVWFVLLVRVFVETNNSFGSLEEEGEYGVWGKKREERIG